MSYDNQQWPPSIGGPPSSGQAEYGVPASSESGGISTAALITGICSVVFPLVAYLVLKSATESVRTMSNTTDLGLFKFGAILLFLTRLVCVVAVSLGIVAACLAGQNSGRRAKGIVAVCLGLLPYLVFIILVLTDTRLP